MTIPEVQAVACIPDYLDEMKKVPRLSDEELYFQTLSIYINIKSKHIILILGRWKPRKFN